MMTVSFDDFTEAFLTRITEYNYLNIDEDTVEATIDSFMLRAISEFREVCGSLFDSFDTARRKVDINVDSEIDLHEVIDIVTEGMVVQWLNAYVYKQENLENMLNTNDFSQYSPAELTYRLTNLFNTTKNSFIQKVRNYSYRHGNLTELHI